MVNGFVILAAVCVEMQGIILAVRVRGSGRRHVHGLGKLPGPSAWQGLGEVSIPARFGCVIGGRRSRILLI
jgi:hypothetical protein